MIKVNECPYCGSENLEPCNNGVGRFHCKDCDWLFDAEDAIREEYRHKISALLMDTSEENQKKCEICLENPHAVGLSCLEMDWIDSAFQVPGDGTIWFHKEHELKDSYLEFDEMEIWELKCIFEGLLD